MPHQVSLESHSKGWMQVCFKKWQYKNVTLSPDTSDQAEHISMCPRKIAVYFHDWNETLYPQAHTVTLSLMHTWHLVYSVKIAVHIVIFRIWEAIAMGTEDPNRSWDQITGGFKIKLPLLPIIMWNQLQCVSTETHHLGDFIQIIVTETRRIFYIVHSSLVPNVFSGFKYVECLLKGEGDGGSQLQWVCVGTITITPAEFSSIKEHKGKLSLVLDSHRTALVTFLSLQEDKLLHRERERINMYI